jgi:hypothetical protein
MHINKDSSIQLEEGEEFVNERQDDDNIWRIITLQMPTGARVTVQRHFRQIGPIVRRRDGSYIGTHLDRETYTVVPIEVEESNG